MRASVLLLLLAGLVVPIRAQEVTGLSGWDIFLDPGHSQTENVGVFGYSEAHKNLEVGLALRELLLEQTDIDTVYMSRTNHFVQVSLSQRVDFANALGASHFHSIHSNAAAPSANFVLILWPQYTDGTEAVPNGGKLLSGIMETRLSRGMRIESVGAIGECDFYGYSSCRGRDLGSGKGGSRNFVQSFTNMASELSEAGFHTNPRQNQLNMNADWKRLEAQTFYWSILDYHGIEHPPAAILSGIVSDIENGTPINGATISVLDTSYTTNTYESLFHEYSNDPDELHNGFYYLDGFQPGATVDVSIEAPGYGQETATVTLIDTFFTFLDFELISQIPPVVVKSSPSHGEDSFRLIDPLTIDFSRRMDRSSVEAAFSLSPDPGGQFFWSSNDTRLIFRPDTLRPETDFTVRIEETAEGLYGHEFDGDADGSAGGAFVLEFRTSQEDVYSPILVDGFPRPRQEDVPINPVITYTFDEQLGTSTIVTQRFSLAPSAGGNPISGDLEHDVVRDRSIITFHPTTPLDKNIFYTFRIDPGLADLFGNEIDIQRSIPFKTTADTYEIETVEPFEPSADGDWWQPQQSGSTTGIVTDSTAFGSDADRSVLVTGSTEAQKLSYGWDLQAGTTLIRAYLGGGPARNLWFETDESLQVYVFGDGSGNGFRFAVDDQNGHEVSPWYTIDWYGWRLIEWDLSDGNVGTWIGDGVLDAPLRFDSFQSTHQPGGAAYGAVWIDELRLARRTDSTPTEKDPSIPGELALFPNYPNPFNPSTTLHFDLPVQSPVSLIIYNALGQTVDVLLQDEILDARRHELIWNAARHPSGVYIVRLTTPRHQRSQTLILAK